MTTEPVKILMGQHYSTGRKVRYEAPERRVLADDIYLNKDALRELWGRWPDGIVVEIRPVDERDRP